MVQAAATRFAAQDINQRTGGRIEDRPVETGLLFDVLAGIVDRSLGRGGHGADRQLSRSECHLPVALDERPTRL